MKKEKETGGENRFTRLVRLRICEMDKGTENEYTIYKPFTRGEDCFPGKKIPRLRVKRFPNVFLLRNIVINHFGGTYASMH